MRWWHPGLAARPTHSRAANPLHPQATIIDAPEARRRATWECKHRKWAFACGSIAHASVSTVRSRGASPSSLALLVMAPAQYATCWATFTVAPAAGLGLCLLLANDSAIDAVGSPVLSPSWQAIALLSMAAHGLCLPPRCAAGPRAHAADLWAHANAARLIVVTCGAPAAGAADGASGVAHGEGQGLCARAAAGACGFGHAEHRHLSTAHKASVPLAFTRPMTEPEMALQTTACCAARLRMCPLISQRAGHRTWPIRNHRRPGRPRAACCGVIIDSTTSQLLLMSRSGRGA